MRILFDMCVYDMRNKGNVALLQVAIGRIQDCWPEAEIKVISISPYILRLYSSTADPIARDGHEWGATPTLWNTILRVIPRSLFRLMFEIREEIWSHTPSRIAGVGRLGASRRAIPNSTGGGAATTLGGYTCSNTDQTATYRRLLKDVDLFIATGAQYMSDACKPDALQLLGRLEEAHKLGIPTAMVGQGIGPIHDAELRSRATEVLPSVDLIFVRETLAAPTILKSVGVSEEQIVFTGDDAIELAYGLRSQSMGKGLGVSVRVAAYTELAHRQLEMLQAALEIARQRCSASLVAIPISHSAHERDDIVLRQLGVGPALITLDRFEMPADVVRRVSRCRIVVTGTYHAAVFALAQGIPVVGLAQSEMYMDKFAGLAEQFGDGCQLVPLNDTHFGDRMLDAIEKLWGSAEDFRPQLLSASESQIALGRSAYHRLHELVGSHPGEV